MSAPPTGPAYPHPGFLHRARRQARAAARQPLGPPQPAEPVHNPSHRSKRLVPAVPPRTLPLFFTQVTGYEGEPRRLTHSFAEDPLSNEASWEKAKQAIADLWDLEHNKRQLKDTTLELKGADFDSTRMQAVYASTGNAWDSIRSKQLPYLKNNVTVTLVFKEVEPWRQAKRDAAKARAVAKAIRIDDARRKRGLEPLERNAAKRARQDGADLVAAALPEEAEVPEAEQQDDEDEPPAQPAAQENPARASKDVREAMAELKRLITGLKAEVATLQVEHRITNAKLDQLEKEIQTRQQQLTTLAQSQAREIEILEAAIAEGNAASVDDGSSASEDGKDAADASDESDESDEN